MSPPESGRILVIRHGPDRGPSIRLRPFRPASYQSIFDDLRTRHRPVADRLRFWNTGEPQPKLTDVNAILCLLQDPLKERFPDCYRDAKTLTDRARDDGLRVINPPEMLSNSIKSTQARIWQQAGILTPDHLPFRNVDELQQAVRQACFPVIVRADQLHTQQGMKLYESREELEAISPDTLRFPGTLCNFIDTREGYQRSDPGSPWAELYHKKRAMVFGDEVTNNHLFLGSDPIVSSSTCTFSHYRSLNPLRRWRATKRCQEHIALDNAFFDSPVEDASLLRRAARALGLEWVAIDYSTAASGKLVLWEANPHFALKLWPFEILPGPRRVAQRHRRFHDVIARFLATL